MSGLFGGQTINIEATRIGALRVQNSSRGLPVAIVYGQTRVSPNLINYFGFFSVPVTTETESGKGGGTSVLNTQYKYFARVMLGLGEGPVPENDGAPMCGTLWIDKVRANFATYLSGSSFTDSPSIFRTFDEFRGTYNQTAWTGSFSEPANERALRGHAYAAHSYWQLNQSAGLQNLSFEFRGRLCDNLCEPDVTCQRVMTDFLTNIHYGVSPSIAMGSMSAWETYCEAANFRVSPAYITQRAAHETCEELLKIGNAGGFWSEGQMKVVPYADANVSRIPQVSISADLLVEDFTGGANGAGNFTTWSGNTALFTVSAGAFGNQMNVGPNGLGAPGATPQAFIVRNLPSPLMAEDITLKFTVQANAPDDAAEMLLSNGNAAAMFLIPSREVAFDALQRPVLGVGGENLIIAPGKLPLGITFQLDVHVANGAGNTTYELAYAQNGVVYNSGAFANSHAPFSYDQLIIYADSTVPAFAPTACASYADIEVRYGNAACITGNLVTYSPDLTVAYNLTTKDFRPSKGRQPVRIRRKRPADCYNVVQVSCLDRSNDYNKEVVECPDLGLIEQFGRRVAPVLQAEMICDLGIARAVGQTLLQRYAYLRNTYEFELGMAYGRLEPMDIVTLTVGRLNQQMVRLTQVDEDENGGLKLQAEDLFIGLATAGNYATAGSNGTVINTDDAPGNANTPVMFQPPVELSLVPQIWLGTSGGDNWGGCEVWASEDDATYARLGVISSKARYGVLTANWAASADPDTTGNLSVDMNISGGTLGSASNLSADAFATLSYVGAANASAYELIATSNATLTSPGNYTMSDYIRRGLFCTFTASHLAGENFMRLDEAVGKFNVAAALAGSTIYIKLRSFNLQGGGLQDLANVAAIPYLVQPVGLVPTNGVVPSQINAGQLLCVPEGAQYSVVGRMTNYGRINLHGRLIVT